jgi:hypothetical protein
MWLASERRTSPRPGGIVLARRVFLALCGENLRVLVSGPALIPQPRKSNGNARGEIPHARDPFSRAHRVRNRQLCMKGRGKNWIRLEAIDTGAMGGAVETGISREVIVIAALRHPGASQTHAVECTTQLMRCASCCPLPQRRHAGRHAVRLSVSPLVACRWSPVACRRLLVACRLSRSLQNRSVRHSLSAYCSGKQGAAKGEMEGEISILPSAPSGLVVRDCDDLTPRLFHFCAYPPHRSAFEPAVVATGKDSGNDSGNDTGRDRAPVLMLMTR